MLTVIKYLLNIQNENMAKEGVKIKTCQTLFQATTLTSGERETVWELSNKEELRLLATMLATTMLAATMVATTLTTTSTMEEEGRTETETEEAAALEETEMEAETARLSTGRLPAATAHLRAKSLLFSS